MKQNTNPVSSKGLEATRAAVMSCHCKHAGQDAIHSSGMRVMNPARKKKADDGQTWRCTVCGATH